ncbi:MAG: aspartyl protease family protein [Proteobacteria bacterium]|nr:aspartyl protease family protein [Pseudomonadota bacterium]
MPKTLTLALSVLLLLALPARAEEVCTVNRITSIPMALDAANGVDIPMQIAGKPVNLLVDTGGVYSMLTEAAVADFGLKKQLFNTSISFRMFGGKRIDRFVVAHDIELGGLKASSFNFLVMPDGYLEKDVGGTLAPDILRAYDVDFDFGNSTFKLFSQDHCEGKVVYWTTGYSVIPFTLDEYGHIRLEVTVDGKLVHADLDTGSTLSSMSLELAESLFGFDTASPDLKTLQAAADYRRYKYPLKTMTFGGVIVSNPDIDLIPDNDSHMRGTILGMSVLRKLHLYIAYREHKLYVSSADAH